MPYLFLASDGVQISLIHPKTRVAPVKLLTLPRLKISGALLFEELVSVIQTTVKFKVDEIFLWCVSSVTLSCITNSQAKGKLFVRHRLVKINTLTIKLWKNIPGK